MIVREWRARAAAANSDAYPDHFEHSVLPALRGVAGFGGATLLRAAREDVVEFVVLTRWISLEAIRAFAGDDIENAVVEPAAVAALVSFDTCVHHYTVLRESSAGH